MAFKFAQRQVADPAAQQNFEQLEGDISSGAFDARVLGQTFDLSNQVGVVVPIDGNALRAIKITGHGYCTGPWSASAAYLYCQINGLSTGNYFTTTRRFYQQGGQSFSDLLVAPTWALMLGRIDFALDGYLNFEAVLSTSLLGGRMPYRAQSAFVANTANSAMHGEMVGAYVAPNANNIASLNIAIALDPSGAPGPKLTGRIKVASFFDS